MSDLHFRILPRGIKEKRGRDGERRQGKERIWKCNGVTMSILSSPLCYTHKTNVGDTRSTNGHERRSDNRSVIVKYRKGGKPQTSLNAYNISKCDRQSSCYDELNNEFQTYLKAGMKDRQSPMRIEAKTRWTQPTIGSCSVHGVRRLHCRASADDSANISSQSVKEGRSVYRPSTYQSIVEDASSSLRRALETADTGAEHSLGLGVAAASGSSSGGSSSSRRRKCFEIQMPSLPGGLEMEQRGSSDDFQAANIRLAMAAAKRLDRSKYKTVAIVMPDAAEKRYYGNQMKTALQYIPGLRFEALTDVNSNSGLGGFINSIFQNDDEKNTDTIKADIYFFVNASTVELPLLQKFMDEIVNVSTPVVAFNLELDTLRSDLGMFMIYELLLYRKRD